MSASWKKWTWRILSRIVLIYTLVCLLMFLYQRKLMFIPDNTEAATTLTAWVHEGETIGFSREVENPEAVWLMLHGNASQASERDYVLRVMSDQDALYVLEYPGYGQRPGSASKKAFNQAAEEAYRLLRKTYPHHPVCVVGESIGTGPASFLGTLSNPPDQISLMVPFDTLASVASHQYPFLPVRLLLLDRWNNIDTLQAYKGPIAIFGAKQDQVIPISHARNLAEQLPNAVFKEVSGGHNDWSYSPEVRLQAPQPQITQPSS